MDVEVWGVKPAFARLEEVEFCFEEGDEAGVKGFVTGGEGCVEVGQGVEGDEAGDDEGGVALDCGPSGVGGEEGGEVGVRDLVFGSGGDGAFGGDVGDVSVAEVKFDFGCEWRPHEAVLVDKTAVEG